MTSVESARVYRRFVRLYPRWFRDEFSTDLVQHFADLADDRGVRAAWSRSAIDLLVTVPRYRLETFMPTRQSTAALQVMIVLLGAAGVVSALAGFLPGIVLLAVAVALAVGQRTRLARAMREPEADRGRRRFPWLPAGAVALALAVAIPLIDGGELSEAWWTVMAAFGLLGIGLVARGLLGLFTDRVEVASP